MNLFKGKGDVAECSSSRGVVIEDSLGKKFSSAVRDSTMPSFSKSVRSTQCGGVSTRGTDYCHHLVKSYFTAALARRLSCGALFVDVVGAFDSLIRSIVFQTPGSD